MEYYKVKDHIISRLTLGTVGLGLTYGISNAAGKPTAEESRGIFSTAYDLGINTIDTAQNYGDAEAMTGRFLNQHKDEVKPTVITKFVVSDENLLNKDLARKQVYQSVRSSCEILGLQKIPICLFHKGKDQPMDLVLETLPPILEDLKNDGLIDLAGISIYYAHEAEEFLKLPVVEAFQVPINIFDHRLIINGMLQQMFLKNKIVFARSVFLQGLFFMSPDDLPQNLSNAKPFINALHDLAKQADMSVNQLAFSFVNELSGITSIVLGAVAEYQVKENVDLLKGKPMPESIKSSISKLFTSIPENIITPGLWTA